MQTYLHLKFRKIGHAIKLKFTSDILINNSDTNYPVKRYFIVEKRTPLIS